MDYVVTKTLPKSSIGDVDSQCELDGPSHWLLDGFPTSTIRWFEILIPEGLIECEE